MFPLFRILLTLSLFLMPLQTALAQKPERIVSPSITCLDLDGSYVFSQESSPVYLGFLGSQYSMDSIMNPYGRFGSEYQSMSVRNELGRYGSSFGTYSANNNLTSTPPAIFKNGFLIAYLTTNTLLTGGISLATIDASCVFYATAPSTGTPPLAAPTSVSASDGLYTDAVEVMWNPVSGADGYALFVAESLTDIPQLIDSTIDTMMRVTGGEPGKVYWFWVAAHRGAVLGPPSEPDSGYIAMPSSSFMLSVQKSGTGSGTVASSPAGIDCGSNCSAEYAEGTVVQLTATPDANSTFAGWSGACTGTQLTCNVTVDTAKSVVARFQLEPEAETTGTFLPLILQ